jgi:hypothetical protein
MKRLQPHCLSRHAPDSGAADAEIAAFEGFCPRWTLFTEAPGSQDSAGAA